MPTITGAIASVSISGTVTKNVPPNDLDEIAQEIAGIYGVAEEDVQTTVEYVTSGVIDVTIPNDVSETDAIVALQDSISEVLGVHPKDVVVTL